MKPWHLCIGAIVLLACSAAPQPGPAQPATTTATAYHGGDAPLSRAADKVMRLIPAGGFISGSTQQERMEAYDAFHRSAGYDAARRGRWFDREHRRHRQELHGFKIDLSPVTNAAYAEFVADTHRAPPHVSKKAWQAQHFSQNYDTQVKRFNWTAAGPPPGRADHPVLLVSFFDAREYCHWRGHVVGSPRRLPTAAEYEKAARGSAGFNYPWGNDWDRTKLNSGDTPPRDTVSVGSYPRGASPYGVLGMAGNVFQWTSTPWQGNKNMRTVKGSAWEDHAGVGRGASQHGRPVGIHHAIVGFRCAADLPAKP